jgi:predicted RNA-binding protein (virulence factor B family)
MHDLDDLLGRWATLPITRLGRDEALVATSREPGAPRLVIARDDLPEAAEVGDDARVFVFLDANGDPVATTRAPALERGQVTFMQVTGLMPFGVFVDWGFPKDLLVHQRFQTGPLRVGDRHPFGLILDETGRLTGTMKVREMVIAPPPMALAVESWVEGEAWRNEPGIGLFVILEKQYLGLLPKQEPHRLRYGEKVEFRVAEVKPDGKVVLSLRARVAEQIDDDAARILSHLRRPGAVRISEAWAPPKVAQVFGLSKKAFKRAIGRLLRDELIAVSPEGDVTLRP